MPLYHPFRSMRQGITLGSLVAPSKCYPMESFSQWLLKRELTSTYSTPQKDFYNNFLQKNREEQISTVSCCTVSSLVLEEERHEDLIYKGIDVVDMECSAFFTGAESVNLKALALFFISDIIGKKPFYLSLSIKDKLTILNAGKRAAKLIYRYFKGF
jgi:purine-nucleoside phosphorylase